MFIFNGLVANLTKYYYKKKELFKELGGRWDGELKTWYIPDQGIIEEFISWLPENCGTIIKNPFFIAVSSRYCWKCNKETPLIALGAERKICIFWDEDNENYGWDLEDDFLLFQNISYLPTKFAEFIKEDYDFFKYTYSKTNQEKLWANCCIHCGALQGDWFNHNEPDGAFFPCTPKQAEAIVLQKTMFNYDIPIVADDSLGDPVSLIKKFAWKQ